MPPLLVVWYLSWCVQGQILHTQLELLVDSCLIGKWILRYLKGTSRVCLCFGPGQPVLYGYTNANMSRDIDSSKSTSRYLMTFTGGVISWQSNYKSVLRCQPQRLSILQPVKHGRNYYGWWIFLKILVWTKESMYFSVIVKVSFAC